MNKEIGTASGIGLSTGLLCGLAMSIFFIMQQLLKWPNNMLSIMDLLLLLAAVIWGCVKFRKQQENNLEFGQGFKLGMILILVATGISAVFAYCYIRFIDYGYVELLKQERMEKLLERMSEDSAVEMMESASTMYSPEVILLFMIIPRLVAGFIFSFFTAAVLRKEELHFS